jgi:hypothetical protein
MDARVGDQIIVDGTRTGQPARQCEVLDVRGEPPALHYQVRWTDGHESVFFPGSTAHIVRRQGAANP